MQLLCTRLTFVYIITMLDTMREVMNSSQRFCLVLILFMLLFGLAAHVTPASCSCTVVRVDRDFASSAESCLMCQLQSGLIDTSITSPFSDKVLFSVDNQAELSPLEHAYQILHPPTLF